jgi:Gram-negative bacterial TonB protein C-terminal
VRFRVALLLTSVLASSTWLRADTWLPPKPTRYSSENRKYYVQVHPRDPGSRIEYFRNLLVKDPGSAAEPKLFALEPKSAANEREVDTFPVSGGCKAVLFERKLFRNHRLAEIDLLNDVAPVEVLVADSGQRIVTLDNWHLMGYGPTTVVIYRSDSSIVRAMGLDDFLTTNDIANLPRSVSSIHWRTAASLAEEDTVLRLQLGAHWSQNCAPAEVRVSLIDGSVMSPIQDRLPGPKRHVIVTESAAEPDVGTIASPCAGALQSNDLEVVPSRALLDAALDLVVPEYPVIAGLALIGGEAVVDVLIHRDGTVSCAVPQGHALLHDAIAEAARRWKFRPSTRERFGRIGLRFEIAVECPPPP